MEIRKAPAFLTVSLPTSSGAWTFIQSTVRWQQPPDCAPSWWTHGRFGRVFLALGLHGWRAHVCKTCILLCAAEGRRRREGQGLFTAHWADSTWIMWCFCFTLPHGRLFLTGICHCKKLFPKSGTIRGQLCKHSWWNWEAIGTTQWIILLGPFMNPAQWLFTVSLIDQEC